MLQNSYILRIILGNIQQIELFMTKIACLTQRPIQTLILMYLIGKYNFKFDLVIYSPLKKISNSKEDEGPASIDSLEYQCRLLKIPLVKTNSLNSPKIVGIIKKHNISAALGFIADTIINQKILNCFKKGVYSTHEGILPRYRGHDANEWAFMDGKKLLGISMIKLNKGVDTGDIVFLKRIKRQNKAVKEISRELYYKYKIYFYEKIFLNLKLNKKNKFKKQKKKHPAYPRRIIF